MPPVSAPIYAGDTDQSAQRWYTPQQINQGKTVYEQHCLTCHGIDARSVSQWDKMNKHGQFPPPPLNGSAHSWHHPMPLLQRTIREGGIPLGGRMPAFETILSAQEIDAVIAWFQSLWPDETYLNWSGEAIDADPNDVPWSLKDLLKPDLNSATLPKP